jgi:hypothetical protein
MPPEDYFGQINPDFAEGSEDTENNSRLFREKKSEDTCAQAQFISSDVWQRAS